MPRSYGTTNVMPYTTPPPVGAAGDEYYNPSTKQLFLSDGTTWNAIVGTGGGGGAAAYTQTITAPTVAGSPYAITHNLGFSTPLVQIWDNVTHQLVTAQVTVVTSNQISVSFSQSPPNNVTVVVSTGGMGPPGPSTAPVFTQTIPTPTVAGSPYTINHNLGTVTPLVQLWDAVTGSLIMAKVAVLNASSLTVAFSQNPPNNVTVVVSSGGMGPAGPQGPGGQAVAAYTTVLTNPTAAGSPYTLTHNLGTTAPLVQLWDVVTGLLIVAQVRVVSASQIAITFSANPPNNVGVVVSTGSSGPAGPQGPPGPSTLYNVVYYQTVPAPTVASSPYSIAHNLNSTYLHVQTWDSVTGQMVQMQVNIVDANHVSLRTAQNMPNAVNVVVTAGPASPAPVNPGDLATKLYVDAKTATLPPPIISGSGVQSFTDVLGDVWIAANGVRGGGWNRPRDTLYAQIYRNASYTTVINTWTAIPCDTVLFDPYGLCTLGTGAYFICPIPGRYLVAGRWSVGGVTVSSRGIAAIYRNGAEAARGYDISFTSTGEVSGMVSSVLLCNAGDSLQATYYVNGAYGLELGAYLAWFNIQYLGTG